MASASSVRKRKRPPGGLAVPDDQGNLGFCSRYALGKAAANGFMVRKFDPHHQLDFDQRDIVTLIVNSDKVKSKIPNTPGPIRSSPRHDLRLWDPCIWSFLS